MDGMYGMDGMDVMDSMTNILDPYPGSNPSPLDGDWICAIPRRFKLQYYTLSLSHGRAENGKKICFSMGKW